MTVRCWSDVLAWWGVGTSNDACHLVGHIQSDSRKLKAGDVFIAVAGTQVHGAMFAPAAKAGGAWVISDQSADGVDLVVADLQARLGDFLNWYYDYPSQQLQLIGITGTNGKTSTSHYVAQWLAALDVSVAVMGTVGNGIWGQLSAATHTTPDAPSVYRQLAQWRDDGVRVVVMEVSSHAIDQQRIIGLSFAVLALTQVTRDHLDYHGSEAHYRAVKKRLFSNWSSQVQVINGDDEVGRQLLPICSNVLSYGQQQDAMMRSQGAFALADGLDVSVRYGAQTWQGKLPLYGQFNVDNVLCALGCVVGLGYLFDAVMPLLSRTQAVAGRMQLVAAQPVVVVDYAHTPDALAKALQALRQHCAHGQIWVVFGAGGNRDTGKRPLMGAVAVLGADRVIVTDDNPRDELPSAIAEEIMSGINKAGAAHYIANRQQAICAAIEGAGAQDVVLIAGKGHEDYQEIAGVRLPFSDVEAVTVCLA